MPTNKKRRIAARRAKTGESYAAALASLRAKESAKHASSEPAPIVPSEAGTRQRYLNEIDATARPERYLHELEAERDAGKYAANLVAVGAMRETALSKAIREMAEPLERAMKPFRWEDTIAKAIRPDYVGKFESLTTMLGNRSTAFEAAVARAASPLGGMQHVADLFKPSAAFEGLERAMKPYRELERLTELVAPKNAFASALEAVSPRRHAALEAFQNALAPRFTALEALENVISPRYPGLEAVEKAIPRIPGLDAARAMKARAKRARRSEAAQVAMGSTSYLSPGGHEETASKRGQSSGTPVSRSPLGHRRSR